MGMIDVYDAVKLIWQARAVLVALQLRFRSVNYAYGALESLGAQRRGQPFVVAQVKKEARVDFVKEPFITFAISRADILAFGGCIQSAAAVTEPVWVAKPIETACFAKRSHTSWPRSRNCL